MSDFDLSHLLDNIKTDIISVIEKHLFPVFETLKTNNANIKLIEGILKQMPEFKQLEKENKELKEILAEKQDKIPDLIKLNIVDFSKSGVLK